MANDVISGIREKSCVALYQWHRYGRWLMILFSDSPAQNTCYSKVSPGDTSIERQGTLFLAADNQPLPRNSRICAICCFATSDSVLGWDAGTDLCATTGDADFDGAGSTFAAHALNSPRMARWIMPNKYPAGLRTLLLRQRTSHSSSTAWRSGDSTCCKAINAPSCCACFNRKNRSDN